MEPFAILLPALKEDSGEEISISKLISELEDKRIIQMMQALDSKEPELFPGIPSRQHQDIYYLSLKGLFEDLLDHYTITKKE